MRGFDVASGFGTYVSGFGWVPWFDRIDARDGTMFLVDDRLAGTEEATASGRRIVFVSRREAVRMFVEAELALRLGGGSAPEPEEEASVAVIRVAEAAEMLGVSRDALDRLIRSVADPLKPEVHPTKGAGRRRAYFWRNRDHLVRWHEEALASKRAAVVGPSRPIGRPTAKVVEGAAVTDWRAVVNEAGRAKEG
jgi:hypothetical protein